MGITAPPISFLRGARPYISNLIERILNLICRVMCIKVLNILFFNMLLYKQNFIIKKEIIYLNLKLLSLLQGRKV